MACPNFSFHALTFLSLKSAVIVLHVDALGLLRPSLFPTVVLFSLQTQVLYRWVEPKICVENITGAVALPAVGQREPCPPCNPGYYNSNDSTCLPCPSGTHSDGTNGRPTHTHNHTYLELTVSTTKFKFSLLSICLKRLYFYSHFHLI